MSNPLRWGTDTGAQAKPPLSKRTAGRVAGRPEAAQYENWWKDLTARSMERMAVAFMAVENDPPDMSVRVLAGGLFKGGVLLEAAEQAIAPLTVPVANPRIDRIVMDWATGVAAVIAGVEAAPPVPPAIPAGKVPIARVPLAVGQTAIVNGGIVDERSPAGMQDSATPLIGSILAVAGTFDAANSSGAYNESAVAIGAAWKLCDGSQITDAASPFNGRYVPRLDDGRFLRGNATAGGVGSQASLNPSTAFAAAGNYTPTGNTASHVLTVGEIPSHVHALGFGNNSGSGQTYPSTIDAPASTPGNGLYNTDGGNVGSGGHSHGLAANPVARSTFFLNAGVSIEPAYLNAKYYQRIK